MAAKQVGPDGLTDAERLDLKVKSETHNRIAENTAAVKANTEAQNKLAVAMDKLTLEIRNLEGQLIIKRRTPDEEGIPPPNVLVCKDWTRKDGSVKKGCGGPVRWGKIDGRSALLNPNGSRHVCPEGTQP
jgi:hypothetical protein